MSTNHTLTDEQKNKLHAKVAESAKAGADKAATAAKSSSGWKKWALYIAAALCYVLAGLAALVQTGCTQNQLREVGHVLHGIYHADTGTPCVFEKEGK